MQPNIESPPHLGSPPHRGPLPNIGGPPADPLAIETPALIAERSTAGNSHSVPNLTSHLRVLALIEPLQRLKDTQAFLHLEDAKALESIDVRYLALACIEMLIDRMGSGGTARRAELLDHLASLAAMQYRAITSADAAIVAEHVFDGLSNARERRTRFMARIFDPHKPEGALLEFSLLCAEAIPEGGVGYRLSPEAIEVHLSLLAQDPLTATQISEIVVQELLKRGLYDHAVSAAERTRTNSVRLAEAIRLLLVEARRAIRKVHWQDQLSPRIEEARALLEASISREGAMLTHLTDTVTDVTDETDRLHLARIRNLLLDVQTRHRHLIVVVQTAAEEYLKLQADTLKLRHATRLPDLENAILDPLLRAPLKRVGELASPVFEAISGAQPPMVLDIAATIVAFEPDGESELPVARSFEVAPPTPPLPLPFDEVLIASVASFAREHIRRAGSLTLGELLHAAGNAHPGDAVFARCLFLTLEQAIDPRTTDVSDDASILSTRFDAGFVEGTDVRYSSHLAAGDPHAPK